VITMHQNRIEPSLACGAGSYDPGVADWTVISSLATAGGTLVLAAATFASVRSSNRAARATERALLAGIRPVLVPSRLEDPPEKVGFMDDRWFKVPGGRAVAEATDEAVYLVMALRNMGTGLAVLDRWDFYPDRIRGDASVRAPSEMRRLTRDLYIAGGDHGFWQGAFRDVDDPLFRAATDAIKERRPLTVDLYYGDTDGGQHTISRFALLPAGDDGWIATGTRHWNLDRDDPR
jgi:hypothetical protein